jgi:Aminotransferase class-V
MTRGMSLLRPRASERRGPGPGPLDVRAIRSHFSFPEAGRIVTNNAASTQPPRELVDLYRSLAPGYENVHRGQSSASRRMTELFEESYDTIAQFIGAPSRASIALYRNTTEAINAVMYSLLTQFRDGDNVVTTFLSQGRAAVRWSLSTSPAAIRSAWPGASTAPGWSRGPAVIARRSPIMRSG